MKFLFFVSFLSITSINGYSQQLSNKNIDARLSTLYDKISYWSTKYDQTDSLVKYDSLFLVKLKAYTSKFPTTLNYLFPILRKKITIASANDGLFRIYSWDTQSGGTMKFFKNLIQYKNSGKTRVYQTYFAITDPGSAYYRVYTLEDNGDKYYIAASTAVGSSDDMMDIIEIFIIKSTGLKKAKIFKVGNTLQEELSYEYYNSRSRINPEIKFDSVQKEIVLSKIDKRGGVTKSHVIYRFNGNYFIKVN